jgi:hypothetical protein
MKNHWIHVILAIVLVCCFSTASAQNTRGKEVRVDTIRIGKNKMEAPKRLPGNNGGGFGDDDQDNPSTGEGGSGTFGDSDQSNPGTEGSGDGDFSDSDMGGSIDLKDANTISFVDTYVKALCVANWDSDGDSELSEDEAAAVTDLGEVFMGNTEITSFNELQFFTGLTTIGDSAFSDCSGLTSITISNSVTSIGEWSFAGCSGLSSIVIPANVTSIGDGAFSQIENLTSVTVDMTSPITIQDCFDNRANATLYVPAGSKAAYEAADYWKEFKEIVEMESEEVMPTDISSLTDAIYANAVTGLKGSSAMLTISLKNAQTTNGYSFDLKLPEGVTLVKDNNDEFVYTLSNRHNGHVATVNYRDALGVYSFAVMSLSSKDVKESDGVIMTLTLNISDEMAEGDYAVKVQNAKYSLSSGATSVAMEDVTSLLTIENYIKGDANGDSSVDIADAVCIVNHIVGKATPAYIEAAADANGDGVVDIADAVRIVNLIVGKIDTLARKQDMDYTLPEPE